MKARVTQKPLGTCCICGKIIRNEFDSNNTWPIRPYSSIGEKENRCKGYGSEALELLLCYGFNHLNLNNSEYKSSTSSSSSVQAMV